MGKNYSQKHKIRIIKTNTGTNHSITLSKPAAEKFSGCYLYEKILSDGILLSSGCIGFIEKNIHRPKTILKFEEII